MRRARTHVCQVSTPLAEPVAVGRRPCDHRTVTTDALPLWLTLLLFARPAGAPRRSRVTGDFCSGLWPAIEAFLRSAPN
jgi:hypothetical protein